MPRPKLPEDEKKGMVLRARTQPWIYLAVKEQALTNGRSVSAELIARVCSTLATGLPTQP